MKALIISADGFEDSELLVPYYRLLEEGVETHVASFHRGKIQGKHGYLVEATVDLSQPRPGDYGLLVLPGGKAPAVLRQDPRVLELARGFMEAGTPVAAICHGPQVLVSAGCLRGRRATCYKTVSRELEDAGCHYEDREVVVDANLVTSRQPSDLPVFMRAIMKKIKEGEGGSVGP